MTLDVMLKSMGSREFTGWVAKDKIDPPPNPWLIAGVIASTVANCMTKGRTWEPSDFMPDVAPVQLDDDDDEQTAEEGKTIMMAYVRAGKVRLIPREPHGDE